MAHIGAVVLCSAAMAVLWTVIGLPIARKISPEPLSWFLAPGLGWVVHSVLTLVLFDVTGMSRPVVAATAAIFVLGAIAALWRQPHGGVSGISPGFLVLLAAGAVLLALVPMAAILPKETAGGVTLAAPIFDHSKIALVDEMIRSGVPAHNPFFGEIGTPERVSYYYLWHFSAAAIAVLVGVHGWEADASLTWFTAFATLSMMIGFAVWIGGRALAGIAVLALATAASMRSIVELLLGTDAARGLIGWETGFGGWMFQTSWAPQHVASAMSVVLACYVISQMGDRRGMLLPIVLALTVAAGVQSSVWVGGVIFVIAASLIGLRLLWTLEQPHRAPFLGLLAAAAALAVAVSAPFLLDQIAATAMRDGAFPIAVSPVAVLGDGVPQAFRRLLDPPAYWLVYLPLEFPAFFPAGMLMLLLTLRGVTTSGERRRTIEVLAILVASSLFGAWLLGSTIGDNNDLGWRAILPAVLVLIPFAAAGLTQWLATRARWPAGLGLAGLLLGLPGGIFMIVSNVVAEPQSSARVFAGTPALWEAVRRHAGPDERVADNPYFLGDMTPWPVNISWALLANRRSCYAGWELAIPFAPISVARRAELDARFVRVFAGQPAPGDLAQLAERTRCDVIVVTAQDGAWSRDPFASSDLYRLVEDRPDAWRIYRRTGR
jgi:hypothetical protein